MNDNDLGSTLLGLLVTGAISFFSYKGGRSSAFKECREQNRDTEIMRLKNEIALLKQERREPPPIPYHLQDKN